MRKSYDVAVVGARGFLGGPISRELERRGHAVARFTRENPLLSDGVWADDAAQVHTVVWAAGSLTPALAQQRPDLVESDLAEFAACVEALAAQPRSPRLVLLSSGGAVYGPPLRPPFRESDAPHPANAYGAYKLAQEDIVHAAGVPATLVRLANAYGPGQQGNGGQGVLAIWMDAVLAGEPIRLFGTGDAQRDFIYVDDIADAVAAIVERPDAPTVLNLGSGHPTRLGDLAGLVRDTAAPRDAVIEMVDPRAIDPASTWLDMSLAHESLGWSARVDLEDGIARMWSARTS